MSASLFSFAPTLETAQVRAWFFDDSATVVQQVLSARMDLATAACLAGPCQAAIDARYTSKGRKVIYVHDWSACQQYDVEARERLLDWGKAGSAMTAQTVIAVSSSASPFVQIALSTGTLVMRLLGMKISVVPSLGAVLAPLAAHGAAARLEGP
jgi:hypothetical protein